MTIFVLKFKNRMSILIKTEEQIEGIRKSSKLAAEVLVFIEEHIKEGVSTAYLDKLMDEYIRDHGAIPAPLNYMGYPKSTCISLNEVVCHGIPSEKTILKNGDIFNVDVTTILNGYYGDTSKMFWLGEISKLATDLIDSTYHCLELGIQQVKPGNYFGNIGFAISRFAQAKGYSVVYEFCGHGVGVDFHEEPQVEHIARRNSGPAMKPGMIFTIEPMINQGKAKTKIDKVDGWTARTSDGKLSAQYEHTILVTETGYEILTQVD
jgi:methionyl aminopeptidase